MNIAIIVALAILLLTAAKGFHDGLLKSVFSIVVLLGTIFLVSLISPLTSSFLKEHTKIYQTVQGRVQEALNAALPEEVTFTPSKSEQIEMIQKAPVPDVWKKSILENNNAEIYRSLNVSSFYDYIASYLAGLVINSLGFLLTLALFRILVQIGMRFFDVIGSIPVIHGVNKLAGLLVGFIKGIVYLGLLSLIISICSEMQWAKDIIQQIQINPFLSYLYNHNPFLIIIQYLVTKF